MEDFDQKCVICGIDLHGQGQTFDKFSLDSNISSHDLNISPSSKKDCVTSLCQILFQFDENICLAYFQNGDYCSQCLPIMRDVHFNWKQLIKCKLQIKRCSRRICELMKTNLNCIGDILPGEPDSTQSVSGVNQRYRKEVVQRIQLVVSNRTKNCEKGNISEADCYQENVTKIKEENLDWETELEESSVLTEFHNADEYLNIHSVTKIEPSKEMGEQVELIENIETKVTYEDFVIIFRNTKACSEQFSQCLTKIESDLQAELSENQKASLKGVVTKTKYIYSVKWKKHRMSWEKFKNFEKNWLSTKIKVKVDNHPIKVSPEINRKPRIVKNEKRKLRNVAHLTASGDEDSADKYECQLSDDSDWQFPPQKEIGITNFPITKLKQKITDIGKKRKHSSKIKNENLKSGAHKNTSQAIDTPLILDNSERTTLKHIFTNKVIKLKRLNETEMALTTKISKYTRKAICHSNLRNSEKNAVFLLKRKFSSRFRYRQKNPQKDIFKHHCKEENCEAKYKAEEKLEGHIRGVHLGESLPHYCTSCPSKFADYDRMKSHRKNVHQGVKLNHYYFCDMCHKGYKTQEELKTHSENSHRGPNPFACAFCETQCTTSMLLIRHTTESHSGLSPQQLEAIKKLKCEKCGRYCASRHGLRSHYLLKHSEMQDKSFSCEQCGKTFASKPKLEYHTDRVHTLVICETCGKSCAKAFFSAHQIQHTRILKHKCKICGKQYLRLGQLRDHERVHSGVRAFVCRVCGKRFLTSTILHGHEKTHEPGYIPRKPIRRKRQNRKNQELDEQLLQASVRASNLSSGSNIEHPSTTTQNTIVNNSQGSQWTPFLISQNNAFVNQM